MRAAYDNLAQVLQRPRVRQASDVYDNICVAMDAIYGNLGTDTAQPTDEVCIFKC